MRLVGGLHVGGRLRALYNSFVLLYIYQLVFCAAISRSLQNNLPHPYLLLRIHNYGLLRVVLISLDLNLILLLHYTFVRVVVVIISHL